MKLASLLMPALCRIYPYAPDSGAQDINAARDNDAHQCPSRTPKPPLRKDAQILKEYRDFREAQAEIVDIS